MPAAAQPGCLASLGDGLRVVVWGARGAIGAAVTKHLSNDPRIDQIYAVSRKIIAPPSAHVTSIAADFGDEAAIAAVAEQCSFDGQPLNAIIIATGTLHDVAAGIAPEKTWRSLSADQLQHIFKVNTIGPALIGKHMLPCLARNKRVVFAALSARVGSISDNRMGGWHAYRASKAALNMLLRNFAIEMARRNPEAICAGLHPGTVDSQLSAPFQSNVPARGLFTADYAATKLLTVLDSLRPEDSGNLFAWDGARIDP